MSTNVHPAPASFTPEEMETIHSELVRVLGSPTFQGSRRCHDFLSHIVARTLDGELDGLTERFLGAELFGRSIDYDTKSDSIVRVRANDVRRRLLEYYSDLRPAPEVVIVLSAGSYVPEFHWNVQTRLPQAASAVPADHSGPLDEVQRDPEPQPAESQERSSTLPDDSGRTPNSSLESKEALIFTSSGGELRVVPSRRTVTTVFTIALVLVLASLVGTTVLWQKLRAAHQALYPWQNSPTVAGLWSNFLDDQRETDLVVSDSSFSLVEALTNKPFNLNDYLGRTYMGHLEDQDPKMAAALGRISNWGLGSSEEFEVAQRLLALDPIRQKMRFYLARKYQPDLMRRDNVILMGSRYGNPWAELFESRMNFVFDSHTSNQIVNREPKAGEASAYTFDISGSVGYCIVAYLPMPDHNGDALLIQGTSGEPTVAGVDFLLSEAKLSSFQRRLGASQLPHFELLMKTSWVKGTPIDSTIVAYRTYTPSN